MLSLKHVATVYMDDVWQPVKKRPHLFTTFGIISVALTATSPRFDFNPNLNSHRKPMTRGTPFWLRPSSKMRSWPRGWLRTSLWWTLKQYSMKVEFQLNLLHPSTSLLSSLVRNPRYMDFVKHVFRGHKMCQHLLLRRSDFEGVNVENADFTDVLLAWIELFSSYKHRKRI